MIEYFIEERYDDKNILRKYICSVYDLCCGNLDGLARKGKYGNKFSNIYVSRHVYNA